MWFVPRVRIPCEADLVNTLRHIQQDYISIFKYHGSGRQDKALRCFESDIVFTTYKTMIGEQQSKDASKTKILHNIEWFRIILDEGNNLPDECRHIP